MLKVIFEIDLKMGIINLKFDWIEVYCKWVCCFFFVVLWGLFLILLIIVLFIFFL